MIGNAPIILECAQGDDEWNKARAGIPTASGFKNIMPGAKQKYLDGWWSYLHLKVAERMLGRPLQEYDLSSNRAVQNGRAREPEARCLFEQEKGLTVRQIGFAWEPRKRWGCSPDGLIGEDGILEIKAPTEGVEMGYHLNAWKIREYYPQIYGNMLILQRDHLHFYGYHPEFPPYEIVFHNNDQFYTDYTKLMIERLEEFCVKLDKETERAQDMFSKWNKSNE